MLLGGIADDFMGASDLARTLATAVMVVVEYSGVAENAAEITIEAALLR